MRIIINDRIKSTKNLYNMNEFTCVLVRTAANVCRCFFTNFLWCYEDAKVFWEVVRCLLTLPKPPQIIFRTQIWQKYS